MEKKKILLGVAVSALLVGTQVLHTDAQAAEVKKGKCYGINSCKGTGACEGKHNECEGLNACKGMGYVLKTEDDCDEEGGRFRK